MSWFSGKSKDQAAEAPKSQKSGPVAEICPTCERRRLPGAPCPFCTPQHFGDELPEGTTSANYDPKAGAPGSLAGVTVALEMARQHKAGGFLHIFKGPNAGASVLLCGRTVTIGRAPDQNLLGINDAGCSSRQCEVRPLKGGYQVMDVGSKNGTYVNDKRVQSKDLADADVIGFGQTRIFVGIVS